MVAILGVIVIIYAMIAAFVSRPSGYGYLDIDAPEPNGARALAEVLRARGVDVSAQDTVGDLVGGGGGDGGGGGGAGARTVLVTNPDLLTRDDLDRLTEAARSGSDVVFVAPSGMVLSAMDLPVEPGDAGSGDDETDPGCPLPEATTAGATTIGDAVTFTTTGGSGGSGGTASMHTVLCYGEPDEPDTTARLAVLTPTASTDPTADAGRLVLLGSGGFLTNDRLDETGNAALALGLLARHAELHWVTPVAEGPDAVGGRSLTELLPRAFWLACLQALIGLVALALWQGRRLGPPVPEPLPVLVRASETVEGRGRLYAAARAQGLAGEALRAGLRVRLADRLGLPTGPAADGRPPRGARGPDPTALVASVAKQTGRSPSEIASLLYGSHMTDPARHTQGGYGPPGPGWTASGPMRYGAPTPDVLANARTDPASAADDAAFLRLARALDELDRQVGTR